MRTFVCKVMSLLFNMLSKFVIAFLPRSKHLVISWLQSPSTVIFGAQQSKICTCFHCFPIYLPGGDGTGCHDLGFFFFFKPLQCCKVISLQLIKINGKKWSLFFKCWVLSQLFHSPLTFIKNLFRSSLLPAIRVVASVYLRLLIFPLAILIPACASSSPAFQMMYSAYKLNKQGDNRKPQCTPFSIWNQSVVPCPVLTVASWPAYRFLRMKVRWSGISNSLRIFHSGFVIHTVKGFSIVYETGVDAFLEFSCFFSDPVDVGNLISDSSDFSKSSLNIWKFLTHILLRPGELWALLW